MSDMRREGFEAWIQTTCGWKACKARNKPMHMRQNADGSYNDFRVNDRWFAWQAAMRYRDELLAILDASHGYVCVPVEPTEAMINAGSQAGEWGSERDVWSAMLAASKETNRG